MVAPSDKNAWNVRGTGKAQAMKCGWLSGSARPRARPGANGVRRGGGGSARKRSVSRVLSDDESSGRSFLSECGHPHPPAADPRRLDRGGLPLAAYLALLRLGFTVPPPLPVTRWALTPPFHPCPQARAHGRSVFCGTVRHANLAARVPRRYLAVCPRSPDFPRKPASRRTVATVRPPACPWNLVCQAPEEV